jgi:hypothetical protein
LRGHSSRIVVVRSGPGRFGGSAFCNPVRHPSLLSKRCEVASGSSATPRAGTSFSSFDEGRLNRLRSLASERGRAERRCDYDPEHAGSTGRAAGRLARETKATRIVNAPTKSDTKGSDEDIATTINFRSDSGVRSCVLGAQVQPVACFRIATSASPGDSRDRYGQVRRRGSIRPRFYTAASDDDVAGRVCLPYFSTEVLRKGHLCVGSCAGFDVSSGVGFNPAALTTEIVLPRHRIPSSTSGSPVVVSR